MVEKIRSAKSIRQEIDCLKQRQEKLEAIVNSMNNETDLHPLEVLDLSPRAYNPIARCIQKQGGVPFVEDVIEWLERDPTGLLAIRGFGEKYLDELKFRLHLKGFIHIEET
jgi:DNA-directed RNA polymerase alpha subunit